MPQLLVELLSEEIPARMQGGARRDLERMARERLTAERLAFERLRAFAGPRRLTLVADGVPAAQTDQVEERKGPRAGAPEAAIAGFLRSAGVTRDALVERDGVLFATTRRAGRSTGEVASAMVADIVRGFPWPKSMTWGAGKLRWVRPLRRILCVFDRRIVPIEIEGLESSDLSEGHRAMGTRAPFRARDFDEYRESLAGHFVVLDPEERKARIRSGAAQACARRGLDLVEDEGLLEEVAGLAEWPVALVGEMDPAFLALPPEVIRTSMRTHQRYFAVRSAATGSLAPHFVVIANIESPDGGALVAAGNARVLSARLKDAQFFWEEDLKAGFERWLERLEGVTFHARLGSLAERVRRLEQLAGAIAPAAGADPARAREAARLAKADLASGMVGEFPELQGIMGGYYAREAGLPEDVADAITHQYQPAGPTDDIPGASLSMAVALADKVDLLAGFFAIGERPTGSRDPYGLRRAALGLARIVLKSGVRLPARWAVGAWFETLPRRDGLRDADEVAADVAAFLVDRLKVLLRDQGARHDLVDAALSSGDDDLVRIVRRAGALERFLATEDGLNLLTGFKRAANILAAERKKGPLPEGGPVVQSGAPAAEVALIEAVAGANEDVAEALAVEDFERAMRSLSRLRAPVDAFFASVLVNSDVARERENRLKLLARVHSLMGEVADFSAVAG